MYKVPGRRSGFEELSPKYRIPFSTRYSLEGDKSQQRVPGGLGSWKMTRSLSGLSRFVKLTLMKGAALFCHKSSSGIVLIDVNSGDDELWSRHQASARP